MSRYRLKQITHFEAEDMITALDVSKKITALTEDAIKDSVVLAAKIEELYDEEEEVVEE